MQNSTTSPQKINIDAIPLELRERPQWIVWRDDDGRKIPLGKSNDSTTWTTFGKALNRFDSDPKLSGIGYVFAPDDPYCGIDLDSCRDPETGELAGWAVSILASFFKVSAYAEISPSETGVKVITRARKPDNARCKYPISAVPKSKTKAAEVEIYDQLRYFTITGRVVKPCESIGNGEAALSWLAKKLESKLPKEKQGQRQQAKTSQRRTRGSTADADLLRRAESYVDHCSQAGSGERNSQAFSIAGHLAAMEGENTEQLSTEDIRRLVGEWNGRNSDPLPQSELDQAIDSAVRNGTPRTAKKPEKKRLPKIRLPKSAIEISEIRNDSGRTDAANAERFADMFGDKLLYVPQWGRWLAWDGRRWHDDSGVGVMRAAKHYSKSLWGELGRLAEMPGIDREELGVLQSFIKLTNQTGKIKAFLTLADSDVRFVCPVDSLNQHPTLLNLQNGTIDLDAGIFRQHDPRDRLTQIANVSFDAGADCPQWKAAMRLFFDDDEASIRYVQKLLGYSMSGETGEHILPICFGRGANGKSTVWNVIISIMGDYGLLANESLLLGDDKSHPTDKASLYQKRFVAISEPERGSRLRESRVKELTGDTTITARRMREDFWSFSRTHTFWLSTNHLPRIDGTDDGIWRRVRLIPFEIDIRKKTKPIPDFEKTLVEQEASGILNWLLAGFRLYRAEGLIEPPAVTDATGQYRVDSDYLGDFIESHCIEEEGAKATANELFGTFEASGGKWSKTAFGRAMAERFKKSKSWESDNRGKVIYLGIRLRNDDDKPPEKTAKNQANSDLATSCNQSPRSPLRDCANPIGQTGELVATSCSPDPMPCPQCNAPMIPGTEIDGWQNFDCENCGKTIPVEVAKLQQPRTETQREQQPLIFADEFGDF